MKRLEMYLLTAIIGSGLLVMGCGGSSDSSGVASTDQPAASAPAEAEAPVAEAEAPAAEAAAATEPAAEPSETGAAEEGEAEAPAQEEQPQRFVPLVRGTANIEILAPRTTVEGSVVVTRLKIRNASLGAIAMLRVDETWYDKAGNPLPGDSQRWRQPFQPGEVIEIELRVPKNSRFFQNNFQFSHANGKIEVKTVKAFPETAEKDEG